MADGSEKNIEDICEGEYVLGYDIESDSLVSTRVVDTFKGFSENNKVIRARRSGEDIYVTHDHPFLTKSQRGVIAKKNAEDFKPWTQLVVPSKWKKEGVYPEFSTSVAFLLGMLVGDGCFTSVDIAPKVTNKSPELIDLCVKAAEELGCTPIIRVYNGYIDAVFSTKGAVKGGNKLTCLLRDMGLHGKRSGEKFVPQEILDAPEQYVREFVKGLIAADGYIREGRVCLSTTSPRLAHTFKLACLRLGIYSTCGTRSRANPNHADELVVSISGDSNIKRIGDIPTKPLRLRGRDRQVGRYKTVKVKVEDAESFDIYCITVEHHDHLFIANGYIASNTGKTFAGSMEGAYHLTGAYPSWWRGKRFDKPISMWAASDTAQSTRDILQVAYLGGLKEDEFGTGAIPADCILDTSKSRGIGDAVDTVWVKHKSGGTSTVSFKSYDQGRNKFQGTAKHHIHLDEEPPLDIYDECLTRTMTTKGTLLLTMTPLSGLTEMVDRFWNAEVDEGVVTNGRVMVQASWDDADHISEEDKEEFRQSLPPHVLEAREMGIPSIGEGMCYPIAESAISVPRFQIPNHFKQFYAMDFGWHPDPTVALFFAYDPETDMLYITKEYSQNEATPKTHASALQRLGADWMKGVADPYGGTTSGQSDGESMIEKYTEAGLQVEAAERGFKQNGIIDVLEMMREGRLKVFDDLEGFWKEIRRYSYDKKGKPQDKNDHFMDTMRYGVKSGMEVMKSELDLRSRGWGNVFTRNRSNWRTV